MYSRQSFVALDVGEEHEYRLNDGARKRIRLLSYEDFRDSVIGRIRRSSVRVQIDGRPVDLSCAPYVMPTEIEGLRIQADVTRGFSADAAADIRVSKDVRFSLWDASDPIVDTDRFGFPLSHYRLFSHGTQSYPEVVHMGLRDGAPGKGARQYHTMGEDYCGFEKREPILSCTDGTIVQSFPGMEVGPGFLYVRDSEGWIWCYGHLDSSEPNLRAGSRVRKGQRIGTLGIQGPSGRFPHIHVGAFVIRESGPQETAYRWNSEIRIYPWLITAYRAQHAIPLLAVARLHQVIKVGEKAILDGRNSLSFESRIRSYRWELPDGSTSDAPLLEWACAEAGVHSAALWVTDETGNRDVDFCRIKCHGSPKPRMLPTVVITHSPTRLRSGEAVVFRCWAQTQETRERLRMDFGDGAGLPDVACWEEVSHTYQAPGLYVVRVETSYEGLRVAEQVRVAVEPREGRT